MSVWQKAGKKGIETKGGDTLAKTAVEKGRVVE
jgi:hypothetical protein